MLLLGAFMILDTAHVITKLMSQVHTSIKITTYNNKDILSVGEGFSSKDEDKDKCSLLKGEVFLSTSVKLFVCFYQAHGRVCIMPIVE